MPETRPHETLLATARTRFQVLSGAQSHILAEAREDMRFVYNLEEGQWPASIRVERERDGRPCLTSNKLRKFVSVVANQAITTRPAMGVLPVDDLSDPATAKVYERLIRQIEYLSMAPAVYQRALEHAVAIGFGHWRILSRYTEDSFDQELYLEAIKNPFAVSLDPEGQYGFVRVSMLKKEFERKYPNATADGSALAGVEGYGQWFDPERVYVAEYFHKESVTERLVQVREPRGGLIQTMKLPKGLEPAELVAQGFQILRERTMMGSQVKWCTMTGADVLEERDWPGSDIPIIEVCGDQQDLDGKIYKRSLIRDAKDPQRMYNYWLTAQTEAIALVPKAPFLATPEMIRGHETMWNEANTKNRPYLLYNPAGGLKPQRERPPEVQQGAMAMMTIADGDIKDVIGISEAGLGEPSNERSGRAIKMRQVRSDLSTGHFHEQFKFALIRTTKQLIDLIPHYFDTERVVRLRGEDGSTELVPINQTVIDLQTGETHVINDLSVGRFDIEATMKVYQTRREEATEMMIQTLQYAPTVAPYILELIFKYADWPGAEEIAARLKAMLAQSPVMQPGGNGANPNPAAPAAPPISSPMMATPGG